MSTARSTSSSSSRTAAWTWRPFSVSSGYARDGRSDQVSGRSVPAAPSGPGRKPWSFRRVRADCPARRRLLTILHGIVSASCPRTPAASIAAPIRCVAREAASSCRPARRGPSRGGPAARSPYVAPPFRILADLVKACSVPERRRASMSRSHVAQPREMTSTNWAVQRCSLPRHAGIGRSPCSVPATARLARVAWSGWWEDTSDGRTARRRTRSSSQVECLRPATQSRCPAARYRQLPSRQRRGLVPTRRRTA